MKQLYILLIITSYLHPQRAWICVPVADLVGQRMETVSTKKCQDAYFDMPFYGKGNWACPRIGQALFGQEVDLEKCEDHESLICIKNLYYLVNGKKQNRYWTLQKNIITEDTLHSAGINTHYLPPPINFESDKRFSKDVITLIKPWKEFSAGTRFIRRPHSDTDSSYGIWLFDVRNMRMMETAIPKKSALPYNPSLSAQEKRSCFIKLIKQWADPKNGFIPYVWGGFNIRSTCKSAIFTCTQNESQIIIDRIEKQHEYPKSGLDCSGLVALAAQCCSIPYYFKNTTTISQSLNMLTANETIAAGDLIVFPGHVIIISSLNPARIIESRGYTLKKYTSSCGKVHELNLDKVFQGIETIDQLRQTFLKRTALKRRDGYGHIQLIPKWQILKLL
jgi:hypothetical protein